MGLDILSSEDVKNALLAALEGLSEKESAEYRRGFVTALRIIALSFGLEMSLLDKPRGIYQITTPSEWIYTHKDKGG